VQRLLGGDGDLLKVHIAFDRSGRSEGTAKAVFESREAANRAIRDFDGAELEGQVLSLAIVANEASRGRRGGGGGAKKVGDGNFQLSTAGGRKVITRFVVCRVCRVCRVRVCVVVCYAHQRESR
jgi:hypothetical protein